MSTVVNHLQEHSTTSMSSLCQWLTTLSKNKWFLISILMRERARLTSSGQCPAKHLCAVQLLKHKLLQWVHSCSQNYPMSVFCWYLWKCLQHPQILRTLVKMFLCPDVGQYRYFFYYCLVFCHILCTSAVQLGIKCYSEWYGELLTHMNVISLRTRLKKLIIWSHNS